MLKLTLISLLLCTSIANSAPIAEHKSCACPDKDSIARKLIFDAGSTGTRLYLYSVSKNGEGNKGSDYDVKIFPGKKVLALSGVKDTDQDMDAMVKALDGAIQEMLHVNNDEIPTDCICATTIHLLATAGLRAVEEKLKEKILRNIRKFFGNSGFHFDNKEEARVLSGFDEALNAWVAANYLKGSLDTGDASETFGTFDLGGGSTQIAAALDNKADATAQVHILGHEYNMLAVSYMDAGRNAARVRMSELDPEESPDRETVCIHLGHEYLFNFNGEKFMIEGETGNGESVYGLCWEKAEGVIDDIAVKEVTEELKSRDHDKFIGLSSFSYLATDMVRLQNDCDADPSKAICNQEVRTVSLGQLKAYNKVACDAPLEDPESLPKTFYDPWYACMDLAYMTALLSEGYGFDDDFTFEVRTKIKNKDVSWTLGYALNNAYCSFNPDSC